MIDQSTETSVLNNPTILCPSCGSTSLELFEDVLDVESHEITIQICLVCRALVNQRELERSLFGTGAPHEIQMTSGGADSYDELQQKIRTYQQTLMFLLRELRSIDPAQSVFAEIGVGQGAFICAAAKLFRKCYAIDRDFSIFEAARADLKIPKEVLLLNSIDRAPDPIDIVVCWHSLERMPRLYDVISRIRSALRPGGRSRRYAKGVGHAASR